MTLSQTNKQQPSLESPVKLPLLTAPMNEEEMSEIMDVAAATDFLEEAKRAIEC